MTNPKNQSVNHRTEGKVQLRTLSKGELCRIIANLLQENEQLKDNLRGVHAGFEKFVKDVTEHGDLK
jgi:hypothetical protein|tara:strand:+ start:1145 stop:1345 length:201 start_codon:yes stop_codon:yes gene_type:complete